MSLLGSNTFLPVYTRHVYCVVYFYSFLIRNIAFGQNKGNNFFFFEMLLAVTQRMFWKLPQGYVSSATSILLITP